MKRDNESGPPVPPSKADQAIDARRHSGGRILVEQAYAQGKMLQASAWSGDFPRGITPSDIDYVVESGGYFLFAEFNRGTGLFSELMGGQRYLYEKLWKISPRFLVAVVGHNAPRDRPLCSKTDIESLEVRHHSGYQYQTQCPKLAKEAWFFFNTRLTKSPETLVQALTSRAMKDKSA